MTDDPYLANVDADMTTWRLFDQLSPCECGHPQQAHDEDDLCSECNCELFRDKGGRDA